MVINLVGLEISVPTLIWTLINFFLLLFVLNRFLFKPTIGFMDKRKARIDEGLKLKSDAEEALKNEEERIRMEINQTNSEANSLVQKAKSEAESNMDKALKNAKAQVADELGSSRERIAREQDASGEKIGAQMPEYVELLKNKLLDK